MSAATVRVTRPDGSRAWAVECTVPCRCAMRRITGVNHPTALAIASLKAERHTNQTRITNQKGAAA